MSKNYHINGQFRPLESRENFSLKTYDIPGAHPKQWFNNQRPFFKQPDPLNHLQVQDQQYKNAITEPLRYNQRERDPEWPLGKKIHIEGVRAKQSEIEREQLMGNERDVLETNMVNDVFYPRNLEVYDIEGTQPGTLNSKALLNFDKHHQLQKQGLLQGQGKPIDTPWGTATSYEQALPENLKKAREKADLNRDRLKMINEFHPLRRAQGEAHYSNPQNSKGVTEILSNHSAIYPGNSFNPQKPSVLPSINEYGRKGFNIPNHNQIDTEYGRKYNLNYGQLKNLTDQTNQLKEEFGLKEAISRYDRPPREYNLHNNHQNLNDPYSIAEEERLLHERRERILREQEIDDMRRVEFAQANINNFDGRQRSIDIINGKEGRNASNFDVGRHRVEEMVRVESAKQKAALVKQQEDMQSIRPMYERQVNPGSGSRGADNQAYTANQGNPINENYGRNYQNQDYLNDRDLVQIRDEPYELPQRLSEGFTHGHYHNNNPPHQFDPRIHPDNILMPKNPKLSLVRENDPPELKHRSNAPISPYEMQNYANFPPNLSVQKQQGDQMRKQEIDKMMDRQKHLLDKNLNQMEEFKQRRLSQDRKAIQSMEDLVRQQTGRNQSRDILDRELQNYKQNHQSTPNIELDNQQARANHIDEFHNGRRGEEWSVQDISTPKLSNLNNFYENYISEQNKRAKPFTKDDYTYFDTISHLPRETKNLGMGGQYYLDPRKGHVIL